MGYTTGGLDFKKYWNIKRVNSELLFQFDMVSNTMRVTGRYDESSYLNIHKDHDAELANVLVEHNRNIVGKEFYDVELRATMKFITVEYNKTFAKSQRRGNFGWETIIAWAISVTPRMKL